MVVFNWHGVALSDFRVSVSSVAMASSRKIMIAVDDTEVSAYAFTWALHNLLRKSDQVIALTAAPFVDITYPSADLASGKLKF